MELRIRGRHLKVDSSLMDVIDRRVQYALSRFSQRVRLAEVQVDDTNGPRGGIDKRCRIAVQLVPTGTVVVEDRDTDTYAAVSRASDRLGRTVARKLKRRREVRKAGKPVYAGL